MTDAPHTGPERRSHGQRRTYQAGCRCLPCRAAEAAYRARLRGAQARGLPTLGMLVSPKQAARRIRQLKGEGYTAARIAQMAGWKDRHVRLDRGLRIRLGTWLRIRRVARFAMLEGEALPDDLPPSATP